MEAWPGCVAFIAGPCCPRVVLAMAPQLQHIPSGHVVVTLQHGRRGPLWDGEREREVRKEG